MDIKFPLYVHIFQSKKSKKKKKKDARAAIHAYLPFLVTKKSQTKKFKI